MNSNFWNYLDLSTPVFISSPLTCSNPHAAVRKLKLAMISIKNTLNDLNQLHLEAAALSRLVYKTKHKLRQEKSFKTLQMINRCLTNYLSIHLPITVKTIEDTLEDDKGPSRQMLEWALIRIFSVAHLFHRVYSLCTLAAGHLYVRMKIAQMYEITFFAVAVVSRIWTYAQFIVQKSCEWYSSLYQFLDKLQPSVQPWLPDGTILPSELEGTLGYPSYLHLKSVSKPEELISQLDQSVSETDKEQINGKLTSLFDFDDIGETVTRVTPKENSVENLEISFRVSPKENPFIDLETESKVSHKGNSVIDLEDEEGPLSANNMTSNRIILKSSKFQDRHISRKNQISSKNSCLLKEKNHKAIKTKENSDISSKTSDITYYHSIKSIKSSKDLLKFLEVESALRSSPSNSKVTHKAFMKNCDKLQWSMMERFMKKQIKLLSKSEEIGDINLQEKLLKRVRKNIKSLAGF